MLCTTVRERAGNLPLSLHPPSSLSSMAGRAWTANKYSSSITSVINVGAKHGWSVRRIVRMWNDRSQILHLAQIDECCTNTISLFLQCQSHTFLCWQRLPLPSSDCPDIMYEAKLSIVPHTEWGNFDHYNGHQTTLLHIRIFRRCHYHAMKRIEKMTLK